MAKGKSKKATPEVSAKTENKAPGKAASTQKKEAKVSALKKTATPTKKELVKKAVVEKAPSTIKKATKKPVSKIATPIAAKNALKKPSLRSVYANKKNTLMPLGFGTDFKTKKGVIIFSDLQTGQVHTTSLAIWNRLKLRKVKELNLET